MIDEKDILALVNEKACVDFLVRMVEHKSYTETIGEKDLAKFMHDSMKALGLDTEMQKVPGNRFNAIGTLKGSGGGSSLLFNGHLDTNPATEGWTVDPFAGLVKDDCLFGI